MDKLFSYLRYEDVNVEAGQLAEGQNPYVYLETMENTTAQKVGTS